jgi:hypothetical protein
MKSLKLSAALLAFFLFFSLVACTEPTAVSVTHTPTAELVTVVEAMAVTAVPIESVTIPTPTPEAADPTTAPEIEPTTTITAVPTEPISYTITVNSPQPDQPITVARDFTFSGTISPVPSQRLELELVANGTINNGESVLAFVEVDPTTGNWQISQRIQPHRTGPAMLTVRVAGASSTVPVKLQLAEDETSTIVTVNQPLAGEIAVAGQTLLISGESRNLIDNKIQVGLFGCPADSDDNLLAHIEFEAGNGPWRAQIILPETAAANCETARLRVTTGGLTDNNPQVAWASDQFLTLVTASDERANIFTVWESAQLRFFPGQAATVVGTAVNPVDGGVQVALVQNGQVLAVATAVPDMFGFWETSLTPQANASLGEVKLRISTGVEDSYRELVLSARLGS